jgi:arylsulfatase A-like enzyme
MSAPLARSRLAPVLRWLAPSVVAACAGALVAGAVEGCHLASLVGGAATAGFLALILAPVLAIASGVARGLIAAWQPGALAAQLTDADGAAPRLAGWLAVIALGTLGLAFAMFQSVWLLAARTAFQPLVMSFLAPMCAVATGLVILVLSRPCARLFGWIAGRLDARWRRRGRRTVLRPWILFAATGAAMLAIGYAVWLLLVKPRLAPIDISVLAAPAAGALTAAVVHAAWSRLGRARVALGLASGALTAAVIATALIAARSQPSLTLEIWGDRPLAGVAIEGVFDLDAIRERISLVAFRPTARAGAAHPDIILITIDTVRADHTPPYGGQADMPALRELAGRGAVFEWAFSPSNVTRRSIPSMIIGLAPDRVHGRVVGWALRVDPRHVLVAERLEAGGYETAGFMCCEGFYGAEMHTGLARGLQHLEMEPNGLALARRARAWLEERAKRPHDKPLFLWMHILEPHNWAVASGDPIVEDARRKLYDRTLTQSDQMLGELLAPFADVAPDKAPIVIVSADHGEGLGEHGQVFHSTDLYDSQTHVPLVIAGPGVKPQRVTETVSLTDLTPSLLELAGFAVPRGFDGTSFAGLATAKRAQNLEGGAAYSAMIHDRSNPGGWTSMVLGHFKLIDTPTGLELYDVRADSSEHANLIRAHPPIYDALRKALVEHQALAKQSPFP